MDYGTLIWNDLDGERREYALQHGANTIGRDDNDIVLDSPAVSKHHAVINCHDTGCDIIDLKSRNGAYLNGRKLEPETPTPLRHNDSLEIQPFTLRFERPPRPEQAQRRPPRADARQPPLNRAAHVVPPREARSIWQRNNQPLVTPEYPFPAIPITQTNPLRHAPSSYLRYLPPIYHDSNLMNSILLMCESILDPIERMIDQIDGYFSPWTIPAALLPWLASWVDVALDERVPLERQRALVAAAADLYRRRGTRDGLCDYLRLYTGADPRILEPGDERDLPGETILSESCFRVIIPLREDQVDVGAIRAIIEAEKPAHTSYELDLRGPAAAPDTD